MGRLRAAISQRTNALHYLLCSIALLLTALQCATPSRLVLEGHLPSSKPSSYPEIVEAWTRSGKLYRHLDNVLYVRATWHVPALRQAFAQHFTDIYGYGGLITRRELAVRPKTGQQQYHFFLAIHTPLRRWNDLARTDSIWHVTLSNGEGINVDPDQILAIDVDENLRCVYPHMSSFDKAYLVRFPQQTGQGKPLLQTGEQHLILRIASALGAVSLRYDVDVREDFLQWAKKPLQDPNQPVEVLEESSPS